MLHSERQFHKKKRRRPSKNLLYWHGDSHGVGRLGEGEDEDAAEDADKGTDQGAALCCAWPPADSKVDVRSIARLNVIENITD